MNRQNRKGYLIVGILVVLVFLLLLAMVTPPANAQEYTAWIMCKGYVNLRMNPKSNAQICGYLDCGDSFTTDGKTRNGFIRVLNAGACQCWVYAGYVTDAEPVKADEYYVVVAKQQVICRRWVNGPKIKGRRGYMKNGGRVKVYWIAGDWALTARGYIQSQWLEVDPE